MSSRAWKTGCALPIQRQAFSRAKERWESSRDWSYVGEMPLGTNSRSLGLIPQLWSFATNLAIDLHFPHLYKIIISFDTVSFDQDFDGSDKHVAYEHGHDLVLNPFCCWPSRVSRVQSCFGPAAKAAERSARLDHSDGARRLCCWGHGLFGLCPQVWVLCYIAISIYI